MSRNEYRDDSVVQEKDLAERLSGRVTPGSGATWHSKHDVATEEFLIEAKTCRTPVHRVNRSFLAKLFKASCSSGKRALYIVDFLPCPGFVGIEAWVVQGNTGLPVVGTDHTKSISIKSEAADEYTVWCNVSTGSRVSSVNWRVIYVKRGTLPRLD